jgi:hypothetical protein
MKALTFRAYARRYALIQLAAALDWAIWHATGGRVDFGFATRVWGAKFP